MTGWPGIADAKIIPERTAALARPHFVAFCLVNRSAILAAGVFSNLAFFRELRRIAGRRFKARGARLLHVVAFARGSIFDTTLVTTLVSKSGAAFTAPLIACIFKSVAITLILTKTTTKSGFVETALAISSNTRTLDSS
jgi:hypothetical protein